MTPLEKYQNDAAFNKIVNVMVNVISECNLTPGEMRQAAVLASTIHAERSCKPIVSIKVNDGGEIFGAKEWMDREEPQEI